MFLAKCLDHDQVMSGREHIPKVTCRHGILGRMLEGSVCLFVFDGEAKYLEFPFSAGWIQSWKQVLQIKPNQWICQGITLFSVQHLW